MYIYIYTNPAKSFEELARSSCTKVQEKDYDPLLWKQPNQPGDERQQVAAQCHHVEHLPQGLRCLGGIGEEYLLVLWGVDSKTEHVGTLTVLGHSDYGCIT